MFYRLIKTKDVLTYTYKALTRFETEAEILLPLSQESLPVCPCNRSRKGMVQNWPGEISIKWVTHADTRGVLNLFSVLNACSLCADLCVLFIHI